MIEPTCKENAKHVPTVEEVAVGNLVPRVPSLQRKREDPENEVGQ